MGEQATPSATTRRLINGFSNFSVLGYVLSAKAVPVIVDSGAGSWSGHKTEQLKAESMFRDFSEGGATHLARLITKVQAITVAAIMMLLTVVVVLSTAHLGWLIVEEIWRPPRFLIPVQGLLDIFGYFLLVLIGVELLETLKMYLRRDIIQISVVIEVALIAMARKVITEEPESVSALTLFGIAALILVLAVAFYFERQARDGETHVQ